MFIRLTSKIFCQLNYALLKSQDQKDEYKPDPVGKVSGHGIWSPNIYSGYVAGYI